MAAVPPLDSGNLSFDRYDANAPFCIDPDATAYDGGGDDLNVVIGPGRVRFLDDIYELTADQTTFTVSAPSASTTYYVWLDFNGGSPTVTVNTTAPAVTQDPDHSLLGTVTLDGSKNVSATSDERGLITPEATRWLPDGSASAPPLAFARSTDMGMYLDSAATIGWAVNGAEAMLLGTTNLVLSGGRGLDASSVTVGNTTLTDGQLADTGQLVLDAQGGDLVFQSPDGTVGRYDQSFGGWRFWDDAGEVVRIAGSQLEMQSGGNINTNGGDIVALGLAGFGGDVVLASANSDVIYRYDRSQSEHIWTRFDGAVYARLSISGSDRLLKLGGETNDWIGYNPVSEEGKFVVQGNQVFGWSNDGIFTGDHRRVVFQDVNTGPTDYLAFDDGSNDYDFWADNDTANSFLHAGGFINDSDESIKADERPVAPAGASTIREALRGAVTPIDYALTTGNTGRDRRVATGTAQQWQQAMGADWPGVVTTSSGRLGLSLPAVDAALLQYCHDLSDALDDALARIETLENA